MRWIEIKLKSDSLDWALQHCLKYSYNFFPIHFEYKYIKSNWNEVKQFINTQDLFKWNTRPSRRFAVPKGELGFRIVTDIDPLDHIIYAALVYEMAPDIEKHRIKKNRNIVMSYRFKPTKKGRIFDHKYTHTHFRRVSEKLAQENYCNYYVTVTDISDFFLRIYHHRLENSLAEVSKKNEHIKIIGRMLSQWNETITTGIPIGPIVSRLLGEVCLIDIDKLLLLHKAKYCRYCDDFIIFTDTYDEGYNMLSLLAEFLNENHNLSLQQRKTEILEWGEYVENYIHPKKKVELNILDEKVEEIIKKKGLCDLYDLHFGNIDKKIYQEINKLNLGVTLKQEIQKDRPNHTLIRFILNRLNIINDDRQIKLLLTKATNLLPNLLDILQHIEKVEVKSFNKSDIGKLLLELMDSIIIQSNKHLQLWIIYNFIKDPDLIDSHSLVQLYNESDDDLKREIMTVMAKKNEVNWIRLQKRNWTKHSPWMKRAYLDGTHCLPDDERKHFYKSIKHRLDTLEKVIIGKL